jgi:type II secretory pathway pseudopilin PulG
MSSSDRGFTLIEAIVACAVLVAICAGTTQLFALAIGHNLIARQQLVMGVLASAKLDELAAALGGGPIVLSPADALERNTAGYVEEVVEAGRTYLRRWRIADVPGFGGEACAISVRVMPAAGAGGDVRFTTIRAVSAP